MRKWEKNLFFRKYGTEGKEKEGSNFRESQGILGREALQTVIDRQQGARRKEGRKEEVERDLEIAEEGRKDREEQQSEKTGFTDTLCLFLYKYFHFVL